MFAYDHNLLQNEIWEETFFWVDDHLNNEYDFDVRATTSTTKFFTKNSQTDLCRVKSHGLGRGQRSKSK